MSERALRGSKLGATSYETDNGVELAPRHMFTYDCPNEHETVVPFADEAEPPLTWECRTCGVTARLRDGDEPQAKKSKPQRTHWDMLLERRSVDDLEVLLEERLETLRSLGGASKVQPIDHRSTLGRDRDERKSA